MSVSSAATDTRNGSHLTHRDKKLLTIWFSFTGPERFSMDFILVMEIYHQPIVILHVVAAVG